MAVRGTVSQTQLVVLQRVVVHVTDFRDLIKIYVIPGPEGESATQVYPASRTLIPINNFLAVIVVAFLRYHHNCKDPDVPFYDEQHLLSWQVSKRKALQSIFWHRNLSSIPSREEHIIHLSPPFIIDSTLQSIHHLQSMTLSAGNVGDATLWFGLSTRGAISCQ